MDSFLTIASFAILKSVLLTISGLAFIMLVSALIFSEMKEAVKDIKGKSIQDCLLEARMLKVHKQMNKWNVTNYLKNQKELFEKLGVSLTVENLLFT